jgi:hypothetical protein
MSTNCELPYSVFSSSSLLLPFLAPKYCAKYHILEQPNPRCPILCQRPEFHIPMKQQVKLQDFII